MTVKVPTNQLVLAPSLLKRTLHWLQGAPFTMGGHVLAFNPFGPARVRAPERHVWAGGVVVVGNGLGSSLPRDGLVGVPVATVLTGVLPKVALASEVLPEVFSVDPLGTCGPGGKRPKSLQPGRLVAAIWALHGLQWTLLSVGGEMLSVDSRRATAVWAVEGVLGTDLIVRLEDAEGEGPTDPGDGLVGVLETTVLTGVPAQVAGVRKMIVEILPLHFCDKRPITLVSAGDLHIVAGLVKVGL